MKYKIVTSRDETVMAARVEELLDNGWQLQGGVSMAWNGLNPIMYSQALVRPN